MRALALSLVALRPSALTVKLSIMAKAQDDVTAEWNAAAEGWDSNDGVRAYSEQAHATMTRLLKGVLAVNAPDPFSGLRVLDFGCGTGLLTEKLQPVCREIVALDAAQSMVDVVSKKVADNAWRNVSPVCVVVSQDTVRTTPALTVGAFDVIVASSVCTFVPDLPETLRALATLLKPGGVFIHLDWPGTSSDYHEGFNEANARAVYDAAELTPVAVEEVEFVMGTERGKVFAGLLRKPPAAA